MNRHRYRVILYKKPLLSSRFERVKQYECALGAAGYRTPSGMFAIERKSKRPDWYMPNSEWVAPEDRGKIIPFGDPRNPILGAFLAIWDGVGIHGTSDLASLNTDASHGCIRVHPDDALELHALVPKGTPIYIS